MRLALVAMVLMIAPAALAEDAPDATCPEGYVESPEGCSQQAWVDDCPPDMMCAMADPEDTQGGDGLPADREEPTFGDCGGEVCAYDQSHNPAYGPEDCIHCTPGPTCMDGTATDCDDDVQYIGGPSRGPTDGSCDNCRGEEVLADGTRDAPGFGAAALLGIAALAFAVRRSR